MTSLHLQPQGCQGLAHYTKPAPGSLEAQVFKRLDCGYACVRRPSRLGGPAPFSVQLPLLVWKKTLFSFSPRYPQCAEVPGQGSNPSLCSCCGQILNPPRHTGNSLKSLLKPEHLLPQGSPAPPAPLHLGKRSHQPRLQAWQLSAAGLCTNPRPQEVLKSLGQHPARPFRGSVLTRASPQLSSCPCRAASPQACGAARTPSHGTPVPPKGPPTEASPGPAPRPSATRRGSTAGGKSCSAPDRRLPACETLRKPGGRTLEAGGRRGQDASFPLRLQPARDLPRLRADPERSCADVPSATATAWAVLGPGSGRRTPQTLRVDAFEGPPPSRVAKV